MCAYLVAQAKYNTADKNGETRKERNARFGLTYTAVQPPDSGAGVGASTVATLALCR
jgi:hypothetical protein